MDARSTELTLLSWNIRYFGHGTKGMRATRPWMRRIARAVVADEVPDLVALQEVETESLRGGYGRPQLARFADLLHDAAEARGVAKRWTPLYFPAHRYALGSGPALFTTGLAVLVADHLDIDDHNAHEPHEITHRRLRSFGRLKQRRIAAHVHVRHPVTGAGLDLFNTHLSLPAFFETALGPRMGRGSNQLREARRLLAFMDRTRQAEHAVVVGDFNSAPGSPVYAAMRGSGLRDGFSASIGHDPELMQRWSTARFMSHRMHIDHVFSTPGVEWLSWEPHTACRGGPFHGLSDHAPKMGRLRVRTPTG